MNAEASTNKSPDHFCALGMGLLQAAGLSENTGTAAQPTAVATIDGSIVSEAESTMAKNVLMQTQPTGGALC